MINHDDNYSQEEKKVLFSSIGILEEYLAKDTLTKDEFQYSMKVCYRYLSRYQEVARMIDNLEVLICNGSRKYYGLQVSRRLMTAFQDFKLTEENEDYKKLMEVLEDLCGSIDVIRIIPRLHLSESIEQDIRKEMYGTSEINKFKEEKVVSDMNDNKKSKGFLGSLMSFF